ncbi:MAG: FecR domain-containing protein, partial [Verrucomicrobiota bacterium]
MKTFTVVSLAVLALFLGATGRMFGAEPGTQPIEGNIRILKVKGTVTNTPSGKPAEPLKEGTFIQHDEVIKTGADSQAWLLFSNGTTVTVQPNSTFAVDKFLQVPFDSNKVDYRKIKSEPSVSETKISVKDGTIIADVAKLNKGSSFQIGTPIGVAGIRGTLIQVTVNTTAGGSISVTINLPQGLSDFAQTNGQQVTLSNGQTVTVTSDPVTGTMSISGVSPLNAQTIQQIQALAQEVAGQIPAQQAFEGVNGTAPEQLGTGEPQQQGDAGGTAGFGGDQGTGSAGPGGLGG